MPGLQGAHGPDQGQIQAHTTPGRACTRGKGPEDRTECAQARTWRRGLEEPRRPWTEKEATPGRGDLRSKGPESESARCAGRWRPWGVGYHVRGSNSATLLALRPVGPVHLCEPRFLRLKVALPQRVAGGRGGAQRHRKARGFCYCHPRRDEAAWRLAVDATGCLQRCPTRTPFWAKARVSPAAGGVAAEDT